MDLLNSAAFFFLFIRLQFYIITPVLQVAYALNIIPTRISKLSVCEKCVQLLDVYIQRSKNAQRLGVRSCGVSVVELESLVQFWVKLVLLWMEGSCTGNAM